MKRIVLTFAVILLSVLCLFSCGKDKGDAVQSGDVNASAEEVAGDTAADTAAATDTASDKNGDMSADEEEKENTSADTSKENGISSDESSSELEMPKSNTGNTTDNQTAENGETEAAENREQSTDYTMVWVSSEAALDGEKLDSETDGRMEMQLALFSDGEYIMAAYFNGEMLENYPQQDKYELSGNALKLASGWQGVINDGTMELSYSDGESSVSFYCTLAASGE